MWFNKNIEERLNPRNEREITLNYYSKHKKYKGEIIEEPIKQCNRIFIDVIMDRRTTAAHKFIARLGFKQYVI